MRIFPRSIPLAVQLVCVLVGLVLGTTLTLTVFAYRSSVGSLESSARTTVRTAAANRADSIARMLSLRRRNAEGLLASALSLCGEPVGDERVAWSTDCVEPMVQELRRSERATGMELRYDNRVVTRAGQRVSRIGAAANAPARIFERADGTVAYQMRSSAGALALVADFDFEVDRANKLGSRLRSAAADWAEARRTFGMTASRQRYNTEHVQSRVDAGSCNPC